MIYIYRKLEKASDEETEALRGIKIGKEIVPNGHEANGTTKTEEQKDSDI